MTRFGCLNRHFGGLSQRDHGCYTDHLSCLNRHFGGLSQRKRVLMPLAVWGCLNRHFGGLSQQGEQP